MSNEIRKLNPLALWNNFVDLNAVPRPSKKEEKVRKFILEFAKAHNIEAKVDTAGNVIMRKPASLGMEDRKSVVLQSHLDMVCQKNNDTDFDFETQGIDMYIDGDWVTAKGTTLGADNGIGVAAIMSVFTANDIQHPTLEALLTVDEETGMTGALGLQAGLLDGEILLNLDTEADNEIAMGCAGAINISAQKSYAMTAVKNNSMAFAISVKGLKGGHSGVDIDKGLGNANKMMNRILFALKDQILIAEIDGGSLRNAIPRESKAIVTCQTEDKVFDIFNVVSHDIKLEYQTTEKNLQIEIKKIQVPANTLDRHQQEVLLKTIYTIHNGIFRMSPDVLGLVETSNNLAKVKFLDGQLAILCLTRSATEVGKMDLANQLQCGLEMAGFQVTLDGAYPGWKPNLNSEILELLKQTYEQLFDSSPNVIAYHAGLECGILGRNYPSMDMVSFGPTIRRAHSPDERACITSVQKFWKYLLEILKNIPHKT